MNYLTTFTQVLCQTNLFQENEGNNNTMFDEDGGNGNGGEEQEDDDVLRGLRIALFCALFDHIQELAPIFLEQFNAIYSVVSNQNSPSLSDLNCAANAYHISLIGHINSCLLFLMQFTEFYLYLGQSPWLVSNNLDGASATFTAATVSSSPLEEKYLSICDQFHSLLMRLVALHTEKQWAYDISSVLESGGLLKKSSNWETDMHSIVSVKKLNKVYVTIISQVLLSEEFVLSGMWSNGLLSGGILPVTEEGSGSGSGGGGGGNNAWQCLLPGFMQLVSSIKLNYVSGVTYSIISYYLEALLSSQYCLPSTNTIGSSSTTMNVTAFNHRLMEDLQMMTAFIEEYRLAFFPTHGNQNIHYIRSSKSQQPQKQKKKFLPFSKKRSDGSSSSSAVSVASSHLMLNTSSSVPDKNNSSLQHNQALESKGTLQEYIAPLTHIICALNLSRKDLIAFTQQELYHDFGYQNALRLWQILLTWRQEKKEHIQQDYDLYFKTWLPQAIAGHAEKIKYSLPCLMKLKYANVVKLSTTNALMSGAFPASGNNNNNNNDWENDSVSRGSFASSASTYRYPN